MVAGLGESIVSGLVPGSALGAVVNKADTANPQARAGLVLIPERRHRCHVPGYLVLVVYGGTGPPLFRMVRCVLRQSNACGSMRQQASARLW